MQRQHTEENVSSPDVYLHIRIVILHCLASPFVCLESMGHLRTGQRWLAVPNLKSAQ